MPCEKLLEYLTDNNVDYELKEHPAAFAAQDVAYHAGVPGRMFAKSVLVKLDGVMAMAVIPADTKIDFQRLQDTAGASSISLAVEPEFEKRFPDCELGAMPPFGNLYDMRVIVADDLEEFKTISFNAGTHEEMMTIAFNDFMSLVNPLVGHFTFRRLMKRKARY